MGNILFLVGLALIGTATVFDMIPKKTVEPPKKEETPPVKIEKDPGAAAAGL